MKRLRVNKRRSEKEYDIGVSISMYKYDIFFTKRVRDKLDLGGEPKYFNLYTEDGEIYIEFNEEFGDYKINYNFMCSNKILVLNLIDLFKIDPKGFTTKFNFICEGVKEKPKFYKLKLYEKGSNKS